MFQITVRMISTNAAPSSNWGSLMHGMLMEHLSGAWPSLLHSDSARPITQWIEVLPQNRMNWHIQIMDDSLAVCFLESCQEGDEWFCQHNGSRMIVEEITLQQESLQDYIRKKMDVEQPVTDLRIFFKTITTHKSQGKYVLFPSVELVANSLRNRLSDADPALLIPDDHLKLLTDHTQIHQYRLESGLFGLEGSWVKGYTGQITLRTTGPDEIIRFGHMLFGLASWFGVGIKTTLGMGGCLVSHA